MITLHSGFTSAARTILLVAVLILSGYGAPLIASDHSPESDLSSVREQTSELAGDIESDSQDTGTGIWHSPRNDLYDEEQSETARDSKQAGKAAKKTALVYVDPAVKWWEMIVTNDRIFEEIQYLEKKGYSVSLEEQGTPAKLARAITGRGISAVSYFGHGGYEEKGVISPTLAGQDARGWKRMAHQDLLTEYLRQGMPADKANKLATEGSKNLGLELVRNFSCHSLNNHTLAEIFVKPGGSYWGSRTLFTTSRVPDYIAQCSPEGLCKCITEFSSSELEEYQLPRSPKNAPVVPVKSDPCAKLNPEGKHLDKSRFHAELARYNDCLKKSKEPVASDTSDNSLLEQCVQCVDSLIGGGCYARIPKLAGWGLCISCVPDGGVEEQNRYIDKIKCPVCQKVKWELKNFKAYKNN